VCLAIRVRPPLEPGQPGYELIPQRFQRSIVQVMSNTSLTVESPQGRRNFIFDRVFNEHVGQEGVFEWLKESIESFVTGYNVSLLAYGQSGAGKSYTMGTSGPNEQNDPWLMGISPRVPRFFIFWEDKVRRAVLTDTGVIPRAARALFTKLSTEYTEKQSGHGGRTASGSGIRPPSRLSMQLSPTPTGIKPKIHKIAPANKEWSLRATYVEVQHCGKTRF
jgi:Kinesin motor domain